MNFLPLVLGFLLLKNFNFFGGKSNGNSAQGSKENSQNGDAMGDILDRVEDAQQALQLVSTFNKIRRNQADLTEVIGEIMSNPIAMALVNKLGFGDNSSAGQNKSDIDDLFCDTSKNSSSQQGQACQSTQSPQNFPEGARSDFSANGHKNSCQNPAETPCRQAVDGSQGTDSCSDGQIFNNSPSPADTLFKPVEKIAGVELTDKLKKYYENWYVN